MINTRRLMATGAAVAVTAGTIMAGAGAANAANDPGFKKVKAPKTVMAGQTFIIKCQLGAGNWLGAEATLLEKGASVNANRQVSASGDCSMHVVLNAVGARKVKVVVEQNLGAIETKWLKINVQ